MNLRFLMNHRAERLDVEVTLSRLNLRALLLKIADPDSIATISRDVDEGVRLVVKGEADEIHYAGRLPGQMTLWTEAALQAGLDGELGDASA